VTAPSASDPGDVFGVVIVAAGAGHRFSIPGRPPKQYASLHGSPVLAWSIRAFLEHPGRGTLVVVLPESDVDNPPTWLRDLPVTRIAGGAERSDSVRAGLGALPAALKWVLIHDGARPLVSRGLIDGVLVARAAAGAAEAIVPAIPMTDTLKQVDGDMRVVRTLPREKLWRVQTPQAFPLDALRDLHDRAASERFAPSDDAGLFERYGYPVRLVAGDPLNIKVTTPEDLRIAEALAYGLPRPT
jgi:2-C-methyl-D-erythritol 4-phosphate cytidylyltransferase